VDATVRIWDTETGADLRTLRGHERPVFCVSVSPDGRRIVSGSWDDTVKTWDSAPWSQRVRERETALAAARLAEPLVADLYRRLGNSARVVASIEAATNLNSEVRAQALNQVLMHSAGGRYGRQLILAADKLPVLAGQSAHSVAEGVEAALAIDAQEADPGILHPRCLLWCGEFLIVGGKADRAVGFIELALRSGGAEHYYAKSLGWALLGCARTDEARAALQQTLKCYPDWSNGPPANADFDHWTAAYYLGWVTEQQFVERWCHGPDPRENGRFACASWFVVGQLKEAQDGREAAIAAYRNSVAADNSPDAHWTGKFAAYRLGILTGTIPPPVTTQPTTLGTTTIPVGN
jgi:hypothetical protein